MKIMSQFSVVGEAYCEDCRTIWCGLFPSVRRIREAFLSHNLACLIECGGRRGMICEDVTHGGFSDVALRIQSERHDFRRP